MMQIRHLRNIVLLLLHRHDRHIDLGQALTSTFTAELSELRQTTLMQDARTRSIVTGVVVATLVALSSCTTLAALREQILQARLLHEAVLVLDARYFLI